MPNALPIPISVVTRPFVFDNSPPGNTFKPGCRTTLGVYPQLFAATKWWTFQLCNRHHDMSVKSER